MRSKYPLVMIILCLLTACGKTSSSSNTSDTSGSDIEYVITFDKQDGTGGSDSVAVNYGSAMPAATAPSKDEHNFLGYFDSATGGVQYYTSTMASARNWDKTENSFLFARWEAWSLDSFSRVNLFVETTQWKTISLKKGESFSLPIVSGEKQVFAGWSKERDGSGIMYTDNDGKGNFVWSDEVQTGYLYALIYYQIRTSEDLMTRFKGDHIYKSFILMNDINMNGEEWIPPLGYFWGCLDGNGYTISNFRITSLSGERTGFLSLNLGTIKNLGLENYEISVEIASDLVFDAFYIGGLVGNNSGRIIDCYTTGNISSSVNSSAFAYRQYVGGLVGYNGGKISNCYTTGNASSFSLADIDSYVGGLAGISYGGDISYCYTTGIVTSTSEYDSFAGGLIGESTNGKISNCYAVGSVSSTVNSSRPSAKSNVGGLIGRSSDIITNCYAEGNVFSSTTKVSDAGGLVGSNSNKLENCYATGNVNVYFSESVISHAGGLAGSNNGTINNCYAKGNVTSSISGSCDTGGLVGYNYSGAKITNSLAIGNVSASATIINTYVGGLAGSAYGTIENSYRYSGQTVTGKVMNTVGVSRNATSISSRNFYIDELLWNDAIWDFSNLDLLNGNLPLLRQL